MRRYGNDVREKGASMIFASMVPHKDWENGKIIRKEREKWVLWTSNAAAATKAAYIDINELIALEFERLGVDRVAPLFADARTHSTQAGALLNAQTVVAAIKALKKPNLRKYLSNAAKPIKKAPKTHVRSLD